MPLYPTPERTASAVAALAADARAAATRAATTSARAADCAGAGAAMRGPWDEARAKELLAALGIASPLRRVCGQRDEITAAAGEIGFPLVLKGLHPELRHKTEHGAVRVGIRDTEQLAAAVADVAAALPAGGRYLVEAMAQPGPELLLGAVREPAFGPVVVLGVGGVEAELTADVTMRLAPLSRAQAATMLDELAAAERFRGFRGGPCVDEAALAAAIVALGAWIAARDDIAEVEVNPLRVTTSGLLALDGLVVEHADARV